MSITIFLIATDYMHKDLYKRFVPDIVTSINQFFLPGYDKNIVLFTDNPYYFDNRGKPLPTNVFIEPTQHLGWPECTLFRFKLFLQFFDKAQREPYRNFAITDHCFYVDADARFVNPVGEEVLADGMVGVQHCGFIGKRGTYEDRLDKNKQPLSSFYVAPNEGKIYYGGGFFGGPWDDFIAMSQELARVIDYDYQRGIIPVHNDESALNRYFINHPPVVTLTSEFHYPEEWIGKGTLRYEPKLVLINKWDNQEYTEARKR